MRLGFVGVGKHANRLRGAFSDCGAEIVAYDRENDSESRGAEGFGVWQPWQEMVDDSSIDAIVCCAPPAVTAKVAMHCASAGRTDSRNHRQLRMLATKPLFVDDFEGEIGTPGVDNTTWRNASDYVFVDLWRLYSPAWLALKSDLNGKEIRSVHVDFYGNGPVRTTHSGLLDYGPHALAFALDLGLQPELKWYAGAEAGRWTARDSDERVGIVTGNGFDAPTMRVLIVLADGAVVRWSESGDDQLYESGDRHGLEPLMGHHRSLALRNFCRAFMAGEPSDTLRISCDAMRLLRQAEPW